MSYPRRHRWFRRMVLGLAFASVLFAGRTSVVAAKTDPGTHGSGYVTAGGWSGMVDLETGIPLSAGIPRGDELGCLDGGPVMTSSALDSTSEVARPDGDQIAIEHELEALAQGGMAGYLNPEQNSMGTDRE